WSPGPAWALPSSARCGPSGRCAGLDPVDRLVGRLGVAGAEGAAVEATVDLDAVADHLAPAVLADGRHAVDGALEAVEGVRRTGGAHLERLVVVVAADLTAGHGVLLVVQVAQSGRGSG